MVLTRNVASINLMVNDIVFGSTPHLETSTVLFECENERRTCRADNRLNSLIALLPGLGETHTLWLRLLQTADVVEPDELRCGRDWLLSCVVKGPMQLSH